MQRTRFPISRVIATACGLYALWLIVELARNYVDGPPRGGMVRVVFGFSWLDEDPANSALSSALCLSFFILGGGISWPMPRLGSFLTGMGWLSYFLFSLLSSVPHGRWGGYHVEWAAEGLILLAPAVWYFRACVRDELRAPSPKGRAGVG
jgi:hypothetical protein